MKSDRAHTALDKAIQKDHSMIKRLYHRIVNNKPSVIRAKTNEIWQKMNTMRKQNRSS